MRALYGVVSLGDATGNYTHATNKCGEDLLIEKSFISPDHDHLWLVYHFIFSKFHLSYPVPYIDRHSAIMRPFTIVSALLASTAAADSILLVCPKTGWKGE